MAGKALKASGKRVMKYSRDGAVERNLAESSETMISDRTEEAVLQIEHTDERFNVRGVSSEQPEPEHKRRRHTPQEQQNTDTGQSSTDLKFEDKTFKFDDIRMDKLTPHHIQKFIVDLTECERFDTPKKHGGKLSTKTIKLYKSFVSTVCDYAVKMQIIKDNPCKNVTIPKVVTPEKDFYSVEEAQRLLELFEQEPDENYMFVCFYTVAIYTGFRLGELLGLEWKDIDFDTNVLSVKRTSLYTKEKGIYTDTPKTASSIRSLKVPQGVMDCLVKWKNLQDAQREKLGTQWIDTDRLFTKWNGDYLCRAAPSHFFHKFCDRTGMRYVSNHSMRHLNASLLVNAGVDIKTVQSCLGHSTPTTTLQIYLHTFQSAQARAMDAIAEALPIGTNSVNKIKIA